METEQTDQWRAEQPLQRFYASLTGSLSVIGPITAHRGSEWSVGTARQRLTASGAYTVTHGPARHTSVQRHPTYLCHRRGDKRRSGVPRLKHSSSAMPRRRRRRRRLGFTDAGRCGPRAAGRWPSGVIFLCPTADSDTVVFTYRSPRHGGAAREQPGERRGRGSRAQTAS